MTRDAPASAAGATARETRFSRSATFARPLKRTMATGSKTGPGKKLQKGKVQKKGAPQSRTSRKPGGARSRASGEALPDAPKNPSGWKKHANLSFDADTEMIMHLDYDQGLASLKKKCKKLTAMTQDLVATLIERDATEERLGDLDRSIASKRDAIYAWLNGGSGRMKAKK